MNQKLRSFFGDNLLKKQSFLCIYQLKPCGFLYIICFIQQHHDHLFLFDIEYLYGAA